MKQPNIRRLFKPDPGYLLMDCDLAQADARVVCMEAEDWALLDRFDEPGIDMHKENAKEIFGIAHVSDVKDHHRQLAKRGVHAVNYGVKSRTLASSLGITVNEADRFINGWFNAHPLIRTWHVYVEHLLGNSRRLTNSYGFSRTFFHRGDTVLNEALAWVPQSTVALTITMALQRVHDDPELVHVDHLLQVHDSGLMQAPFDLWPTIKPALRRALTVELCYHRPDGKPVIIPIGLKTSLVSWGDIRKESW